MVPVKFVKLHEEAVAPKYETAGAAGMDLIAPDSYFIEPGERVLIKLGLAMQLPPGFEAQVRPRSGLAYKKGLSVLNSPGTLDEDFRGEVGVLLVHHGFEPVTISKGDRIAQLVIAPVTRATFIEVETLDVTVRGAGGFGSTGK